MKLACHGHFEPAYLLQLSKNDGEKRCFFRNQEWSFRRDFSHYASSDIKLCVKKIWQCAKIIRNNCSKCRAIFKVHRRQTESLIWKFTHFFTTISLWFSLWTGKKAKFHRYYHNGTKDFVRSNLNFYPYGLTKYSWLLSF